MRGETGRALNDGRCGTAGRAICGRAICGAGRAMAGGAEGRGGGADRAAGALARLASSAAPLASNSSRNLFTKLSTGQAQASPKAQMVRPWMLEAILTR